MAFFPWPNVGITWFFNVDPTVGAGIPGVPLNQFGVRTDIPSFYYKSGAADTAWTILSGGGAPVVSADAAYEDDFLTDRLSFFAATGGGFAVGGSAMGAGCPGTYTQTVTAAGVDAHGIIGGLANGTVGVVFFGGGLVTWENGHNIPVLSTGAQRLDLRVGMHDGDDVSEPTDGCYLEYSLALNGSQNYFLCAANNSVKTKTDTGIIAVAGANRHVILTVNALGTSLTATVDGVAATAPVIANIPITAARNTYIANLQAVKALGATALSVIQDYWSFSQVLTTPR